MLQS
jgi:hypothetical protein